MKKPSSHFVALALFAVTVTTSMVTTQEADAQAIREKQFVAQTPKTGADRNARLWSPSIAATDSITNVVYVFDTDYCFDVVTALVSYHYHVTGMIPPTAVVGVCYSDSGRRMDVGLSTADFTLNEAGTDFYNHITKHVKPWGRETLGVSRCHDIFFGHSYLADYGLFYLRRHPDVFDSTFCSLPR